MTAFRKVWFGYDVKQVSQFLRKLNYHSELEISELEQLISKARKSLALASHESIPPQPIQVDLTPNVEFVAGTAGHLAALEEIEVIVEEEKLEVEVVEVVEVVEEKDVEEVEVVEEKEVEEVEEVEEDQVVEEETLKDAIVEEAIVQPVAPNPKGRLLMFRRKMDATFDQETLNSSVDGNNQKSGYWECIDHYLETPIIGEHLLQSQSQVSTFDLQAQHNVSNSAVGLPRYFDYALSEVKSHVYTEQSVPVERQVRAIPQGKTAHSTKAKPQDTSNIAVDQPIDKSGISSVQSQGSNEITREVRQLRYKYIVGKWAGEDLFNNRGELIIRKHDVITEDIVDAAHTEGKLALLIVQMMIPGLGNINDA